MMAVVSLPVPGEPGGMVEASVVIPIGCMSPPPNAICDQVQIFHGAPTTCPVCRRSPTSCLSQGWYIMGCGELTLTAFLYLRLLILTVYGLSFYFFQGGKKFDSRGKFPPHRLKPPSQTLEKDPQTEPEPLTACPPGPRRVACACWVVGSTSPSSYPGTPPSALLPGLTPKVSMCCPQKTGSGR